MLIAHHTVAFAGEGAPEWVHLIPAGTFRGNDGRGPYALLNPAAVIAASMTAGRLPIDENHATHHAAHTGGSAPARGWIVGMEPRADGIWGKVEWTEAGAALMADKSYRGLSPEFAYQKTGEVAQVLTAALTNRPNLKSLTTLHEQENPVDLAALRTALGLTETADEAACLAAVTANAQAIATHTVQINAIRTAAGLPDSVPPSGLAVALQTQRAASPDVARLNDTIVTLQTEVATMKSGAAKEKAVLFVDGAIKAGKPLNPTRDYWIARHQQEWEATEAVINGLPSINGTAVVRHAEGGGGNSETDLTETDRKVAGLMGLEPKAFAEHRAKTQTTDGRAA